jgi:hypothetical protein
MYLARFLHSGLFSYQIRQSVPDNGVYVSRTLYDLGTYPGTFIVYPGGNSFYLDQDMVETIEKRGRDISYQLFISASGANCRAFTTGPRPGPGIGLRPYMRRKKSSKETFIRLNQAYNWLLGRIKSGSGRK